MITADKIYDLCPRVECHIFLTEGAHWRRPPQPHHWKVFLKLKENETKIEIEQEHTDLGLALDLAWDKLKSIVNCGLPEGTLLPSVDTTPQIEKPVDEIPF